MSKIRFIIHETASSRDANGNTYYMSEIYSTKTGKALPLVGERACNARRYLAQAIGEYLKWPELLEFSRIVGKRRFNEIAKDRQYRNPEKIVALLTSLEAE